jgi:hypothetical protein
MTSDNNTPLIILASRLLGPFCLRANEFLVKLPGQPELLLTNDFNEGLIVRLLTRLQGLFMKYPEANIAGFCGMRPDADYIAQRVGAVLKHYQDKTKQTSQTNRLEQDIVGYLAMICYGDNWANSIQHLEVSDHDPLEMIKQVCMDNISCDVERVVNAVKFRIDGSFGNYPELDLVELPTEIVSSTMSNETIQQLLKTLVAENITRGAQQPTNSVSSPSSTECSPTETTSSPKATSSPPTEPTAPKPAPPTEPPAAPKPAPPTEPAAPKTSSPPTEPPAPKTTNITTLHDLGILAEQTSWYSDVVIRSAMSNRTITQELLRVRNKTDHFISNKRVQSFIENKVRWCNLPEHHHHSDKFVPSGFTYIIMAQYSLELMISFVNYLDRRDVASVAAEILSKHAVTTNDNHHIILADSVWPQFSTWGMIEGATASKMLSLVFRSCTVFDGIAKHVDESDIVDEHKQTLVDLCVKVSGFIANNQIGLLVDYIKTFKFSLPATQVNVPATQVNVPATQVNVPATQVNVPVQCVQPEMIILEEDDDDDLDEQPSPLPTKIKAVSTVQTEDAPIFTVLSQHMPSPKQPTPASTPAPQQSIPFSLPPPPPFPILVAPAMLDKSVETIVDFEVLASGDVSQSIGKAAFDGQPIMNMQAYDAYHQHLIGFPKNPTGTIYLGNIVEGWTTFDPKRTRTSVAMTINIMVHTIHLDRAVREHLLRCDSKTKDQHIMHALARELLTRTLELDTQLRDLDKDMACDIDIEPAKFANATQHPNKLVSKNTVWLALGQYIRFFERTEFDTADGMGVGVGVGMGVGMATDMPKRQTRRSSSSSTASSTRSRKRKEPGQSTLEPTTPTPQPTNQTAQTAQTVDPDYLPTAPGTPRELPRILNPIFQSHPHTPSPIVEDPVPPVPEVPVPPPPMNAEELQIPATDPQSMHDIQLDYSPFGWPTDGPYFDDQATWTDQLAIPGQNSDEKW